MIVAHFDSYNTTLAILNPTRRLELRMRHEDVPWKATVWPMHEDLPNTWTGARAAAQRMELYEPDAPLAPYLRCVHCSGRTPTSAECYTSIFLRGRGCRRLRSCITTLEIQ